MVRSRAIAVFPKRHIQHPVQAILNPPMAAHRGRDPLYLRWQAADVITRTPRVFAQEADAKHLTNSIGMKLVLIREGKFDMGFPASEKVENANQKQREVEIKRAFYMGVYEVTQEEYETVMGTNPSRFSPRGRDAISAKDVKGLDTRRFPVDSVEWADAVEFCRKLSAMPKEKAKGRVYSLPTEAEWEWACRGPTRNYQAFHFGNSISHKEANFLARWPFPDDGQKGLNLAGELRRPTTVGSYAPNSNGLYDMHGNVAEWCADAYWEKGYRITRGGDYNAHGAFCRSAHREPWHERATPELSIYHFGSIGFRVIIRPN